MNKFKRISALLLAMLMTVTMLASCGNIEEKPIVDDVPGIVTEDPVVTEPPVTSEPEQTTTEATTTEATTTEATTTEATTTEATTTEATTTEDKNAYTVEEMSAVMYATMSLNVRSGPSTDFDKIDTLKKGEAVTVTGRASTGWYRILVDGAEGFVSNLYITDEKPEEEVTKATENDDEDIVIEEPDDDVVINDNVTVTASDNWVEDNGWGYMYDALYKDSYRQVINEIMEGVQNLEKEIYVSPLIPADQVEEFCNLILPILNVKYCYVNTFSYNVYKSGSYEGVLMCVKPYYYVSTVSEANKMMNELDSAANKVISKLSSSMSDYEKILYLHDWIVVNSVPDKENVGGKWANTAYGSIVDGEPTCLGYAKGLFYLLYKAGFEDITMAVGEGSKEGVRHIWVKVKCGGDWYNIDPTWDDPVGSTQDNDPEYVRYDYFMVTDKYMAQTRTSVFDMTFFKDPSCTKTKYNWHVVNGCYATTEDEAIEILKDQIKKAKKANGDWAYIRIKFSSSSLYSSIKSNSEYVDLMTEYGSASVNSKGWTRTWAVEK